MSQSRRPHKPPVSDLTTSSRKLGRSESLPPKNRKPISDVNHSGSHSFTENEKILIENPYRQSSHPRPLHEPLFPLEKPSQRTPESDLSPNGSVPTSVFGKQVAKWTKEFFQLKEFPTIQKTPQIPPIRPGAPTIISIFYPGPNMRRSVEMYLARLENLAKLNEQTIIYVCPTIKHKVQKMRRDPYWHVISDYKTVRDIPTNKGLFDNFKTKQKDLFENLEGLREKWKPNASYNNAHLTAAYHAKAFVTYDAVMRNPFGSDRWMFMDAGLFHEKGPVDDKGVLWGDIIKERLDEEKFDRSIGISGNTGVVFGGRRLFGDQGVNGRKDINHEWFSHRQYIWQAHHFAGAAYAGSSLGMLNFAVRYMQTVNDLDANDYYIGREEFVYDMLTVRYPNTIFYIPWVKTLKNGNKDNFPMNTCYSTYGDKKNFKVLPAIDDPISTLFCYGYTPRKPNLDGTGRYKKLGEELAEELSLQDRLNGKTGYFEGSGKFWPDRKKREAEDLEIMKERKAKEEEEKARKLKAQKGKAIDPKTEEPKPKKPKTSKEKPRKRKKDGTVRRSQTLAW